MIIGTHDEELVKRAIETNREFAGLHERHAILKKRIAELTDHPHPTPAEDLELHNAKKEKLAAKDRMAQILTEMAK